MHRLLTKLRTYEISRYIIIFAYNYRYTRSTNYSMCNIMFEQNKFNLCIYLGRVFFQVYLMYNIN